MLTEHQLDGSGHSILGAHILAISLSSHCSTVQSHHHHHIICLHCSEHPCLSDGSALCQIVDWSATVLVVLAIAQPPALMELAGQEYSKDE